MKCSALRSVILVLSHLGIVFAMVGSPAPLSAQVRTKAVQETVDYVLERFGRTAAREGAETLARRVETMAARHGDDFLRAIRQVGPRAIPLVEEAGSHATQAVRALALHGEHGATWIVGRPKGMQLFLKYGEEGAAALVTHKGIAEPVLEHLGRPALKALQAASPQQGRRLAMMIEGGELARIGRTAELLDVIGKYGDRAMTFVWDHKGALATTAALTAFLGHPDAFLNGAKDLAQIVGENAIKPVEIPASRQEGIAGHSHSRRKQGDSRWRLHSGCRGSTSGFRGDRRNDGRFATTASRQVAAFPMIPTSMNEAEMLNLLIALWRDVLIGYPPARRIRSKRGRWELRIHRDRPVARHLPNRPSKTKAPG
jgi:hypothetical protein